MTNRTNPQLDAAASILVEAEKLVRDESVSGVDRYVTLSLLLAEIAMLRQSVRMPEIVAVPNVHDAATLAAVVANVIERLGRADKASGSRELLHQLSLRIERALAASAAAPAGPATRERKH